MLSAPRNDDEDDDDDDRSIHQGLCGSFAKRVSQRSLKVILEPSWGSVGDLCEALLGISRGPLGTLLGVSWGRLGGLGSPRGAISEAIDQQNERGS